MATVTINTSKDASALDASTYSWNGKDNHHPVGINSNGYLWRSFIYFPISFSGWTGITSATMYLKAHHPSTGIHVYGTTTTTMYIDRMTSDWGEDVGSENVWTTDPNGYSWSSRAGAYTTSNQASFTSGQPGDGSWVSFDITNIVKDWFAGNANYGVILRSSNEGSSATAFEWWSREGGYPPYVVINYSTNTPPNAPINLNPTGGAIVNSLAPTFTGNSSDPDAGDSMGGYEIQVYNDAQTSLIWDSGSIAAAGSTSFSKQYAGSALTGNTYYQWRARTYDKAGAWGPYSAFQRFKVNSPPNAPSLSISGTAGDELTLSPTLYVTASDPDPGDGSMYGYRVLIYDSGNNVNWDTGNTSVSPTTTLSLAYAGPGLAWQTQYHYYAYTEDSNGAWGPWGGPFYFTTHTTAIPTSLAPAGGTTASSLAPTLNGARGSTEDSLVSANVQVYDSTGTTLIWDSGTFTAGVSSTAFSIAYGGSTLAYSTTYTWRARVTGSIGGTSAWSGLQSFVTPASGNVNQSAPLGSPITTLTPGFTFTRTATFNAYQLIVYEANGTTVHWSSGTVSIGSLVSSETYTYAGTALLWNTTYQWKVQVSSDNGTTWGSGWSGLASFTTDSAGLPTLSAPAVNGWLTTLTPTISGTTYNAELATAFRVLVYAADQTTLVWDSGDIVQAGATTFSTVYSGATALTYGTVYYVQARYTKSTGPTGNYCALQMFHINAIPTMPNTLLPATGAIIQDSLLPTFTCTFVDADISLYGDTPSKLEIEVYRQSDNLLFGAFNTTTGLVAGANSLAYPSVGVTALVYETVYIWHARYTDSQGAVGPWSSYQSFKPSQSSTLTITAPGATIVSPKVTATWTFSSPGGKSQQQYRLTITNNATLVTVYDSGWVTSTAGTHTVPAGYLTNNETYSFALTALDTDGI